MRAARWSAVLVALVLAAPVAAQSTAAVSVTRAQPSGSAPRQVAGDCLEACAGTPEVEPNCGLAPDGSGDDYVDGGCNSEPPVFWPIAMGETVCGGAGFVHAPVFTRDTDWFELVVEERSRVTFRVESQFPALIGILDTHGQPNCRRPSSFLDWTFTTGCGDVGEATALLRPGVWWLFVAPDFIGPPIACGNPLTGRYRATVTGEPRPLPEEIPTLSGIGLALFAAGLALLALRRTRPRA